MKVEHVGINHFERSNVWPCNYIALGDTICSMNPAYGQGMSQGALHVSILEKMLNEYNPKDATFSCAFQRKAASMTEMLWTPGTNEC